MIYSARKIFMAPRRFTELKTVSGSRSGDGSGDINAGCTALHC